MTVYEKLLKVQKELKAPKNAYNAFGKYNYRSCEDILEGLKPVLEKYKATLFITDDILFVEGRFYVKATAIFVDIESGETISNTAYARESDDKRGMDSSQVTGATSSYARKYALNGLFLIDDTKDADTNEFTNQQNKKASTKSKETEHTEKNITGVDNNPNLIPEAETLISNAQIEIMESELKRTGVPLAQILDMAKVDAINKMNQATACALINKLKKSKSLEEKNNG